MQEINETDFASPSVVFQIGVPPGRIDILTVVSGLDFDSAWTNQIWLTIDDVKFPVIGRADLMTNKRAAGRPKDLADIAGLEASENS